MYSPSLETLLKSIKQSAANPAPFKKSEDVQSGLPFKLFPSKINKKKIVVVANDDSNIRLVNSILVNLSKSDKFILYYKGPEVKSLGDSIKHIDSVNDSLGADNVLLIGLVDKLCESQHYLILEDQKGLLFSNVDLINKKIDKIYVFSEFYKKIMLVQGVKKPICVIKLGLDSEPVKNGTDTRDKMALANDSFVIVNPSNSRTDLAIKIFTKLLMLYPDYPLVLLCVSNCTYAIDIYKYELMQSGLLVQDHISKLLITEKQDYAFAVADVGLHTDSSDKIRYDFLDFIGLGAIQVVPNFGFYSAYKENTKMVEIKETHFNPNSNSLGLYYSFDCDLFVKAVQEILTTRVNGSGSTYTNSTRLPPTLSLWADELIKSLL